ncbi:MAG: hypothetical protein AAB225_15850, partial [Acidobacteriota bacterium]
MTRAAYTAILLAATMICGTGAAWAETVTLQQGAANYNGCTTRTMVETRPSDVPDDGLFYLRGSLNSLHLRFELPKREGALARARLMVFLPSARRPNKFTEIFCHEAISGGRQLSFDEVTDYDNGRRKGAVDSVELFAPPHEGWPDFPFLPLGVPEGGRWIEFNITPLVERWLSREAANHGVMLIPTDCPDPKSPSTWEIDIPTATNTEVPLRPKLVLEYDQPELLAGMTDSLRRICDRSTRYGHGGPYATSYKLSMAADEFEALQVVLYPMLSDLKGVRLDLSGLVSGEGNRIPAADIEYFTEDVYQLRRNWMTRGLMFAGKLYDTADPLVPGKPIDIRRHTHTPFYVRVRTRPDTPAGTYRG